MPVYAITFRSESPDWAGFKIVAVKLPSGLMAASRSTETPTVGRLPPKAERSVWAVIASVNVSPFGALMTRLLLVMLFTGPINEMPPARNATGVVALEAGGWVAVGGTCLVDGVVVAVTAGVPPEFAHAVIKIIITRTMLHTSIP